MGFRPREILFSPTAACNLNCPHCAIAEPRKTLSILSAQRFLDGCKKLGIRRVGFTGGEPFLAADFLCALTRKAVKKGMFFDRIMTNGVWYNNTSQLDSALAKLYRAGYDGEICVSVDAFHAQGLKKAARFIRAVLSVWKRQDVVSIACVIGSREAATGKKLRALARLLGARLAGFGGRHPRIKNSSLFIKIFKIGLSPIGKASGLKNGWDGRWFKGDRCEGPGNVFFVLPDGKVKPCCGYASGSEELTIGNMNRDSAPDLMRQARANSFVRAVFGQGLARVRKRLENSGVRFPGKTSNNCFFCHYLLTKVPRRVCERSLR